MEVRHSGHGRPACIRRVWSLPAAAVVVFLAVATIIAISVQTQRTCSLYQTLYRAVPGRHVHGALQPVIADTLPLWRAPAHWFAVVTAAYNPAKSGQAERQKEYRLGLGYVFARFERVAGVISAAEPMPLVSEYNFQPALYFNTSPQYTNKSAKESEALRHFVRELNMTHGSRIPDSAIVFKMSGRYQVARDDFLQAVMTKPEYDVWAKPFGTWALKSNGAQSYYAIYPGDERIFTFYFAMRWPIFRDMYMHVDLVKLESFDTVPSKGWKGYDIESYVMDFVKERGLRLWRAPHLHVIANIKSMGMLQYI
jgi:hypothetical protein